ncbi:MAG TPA: hypothetical protein VFB12_24575 [Ktedonobacteraceae bacterium]|nr:hypothetical protein [Ktedonobacteraceae bacterium]
MLNKLLDEDPEIQQRMALARKQGELEGEIKGAQRLALSVLEIRFPTLTESARHRIMQINKIDLLNLVAKQIATAPDEATIRWVLTTFVV